MVASNPRDLVDDFKKSGEFDRLRRELLKDFQQGEAVVALKTRVEGIARARLTNDSKLRHMAQESVHRELMQEVDRYPIVERAAAELHAFSNSAFISSVKSSVHRILLEGHGEKSDVQKDATEGRDIGNHDSAQGIIIGDAKAVGIEATKPTVSVSTLEVEPPSRPSSTPVPIAVVPPSPDPSVYVNGELVSTSMTPSFLPTPLREPLSVDTGTPIPANDVLAVHAPSSLLPTAPNEGSIGEPVRIPISAGAAMPAER